MSRTIKGSKGPGHDYWKRRLLSASCGFGPDVKRATVRKERAVVRQQMSGNGRRKRGYDNLMLDEIS